MVGLGGGGNLLYREDPRIWIKIKGNYTFKSLAISVFE